MTGNETAIATGAIALFQYVAGAISITIAQAVFQNLLGPSLARNASGVDAKLILNSGATGFRAVIPPDQLTYILRAYNEALVKVLMSGAPEALERSLIPTLAYSHCHRCSRTYIKLWIPLD
jgi:hypothetical protein